MVSYRNFRNNFESGYKQITGNDGSTEQGSQLTIINAIKVLAENSYNDLQDRQIYMNVHM